MKLVTAIFTICIAAFACSTNKNVTVGVPPYVPESKELYDSIVRADSLFFDAYNTCKPDVMEAMISEDLEFYHDRGGVEKSKANLLDGLKRNICGKVRRELMPGSIEVYPVPGFGAIQFGAHRFYNLVEKSGPSRYAKFVHTWKRVNGQWKLSRVISLH